MGRALVRDVVKAPTLMQIVVTPDQAGMRLDKLLQAHVPSLGRAGAKRLFDDDRVRVVPAGKSKARKAQKGDLTTAGDVVELDLDPTVSDSAAPEPNAPIRVLLERPDIVIVDKPAHQPTAPLRPGETGALANALVGKYPEMAQIGFHAREPGICHRLDTDTSGIVLAARTKAAFETLTLAIKEGRLEKRYLLFCQSGGPESELPLSGEIDLPLAPHPKDKKRVYACVHPRDVVRYSPRPAITHYERLGELPGFGAEAPKATGAPSVRAGLFHVEVSAPKALRHQIRAHFAAIGHPLAGDTLYGGPEVPGLSRHALHASRIVWTGDKVVPAFDVTCPLPDDLKALLSP